MVKTDPFWYPPPLHRSDIHAEGVNITQSISYRALEAMLSSGKPTERNMAQTMLDELRVLSVFGKANGKTTFMRTRVLRQPG